MRKPLSLKLSAIWISVVIGMTGLILYSWDLFQNARASSCYSDGIGNIALALKEIRLESPGNLPTKELVQTWFLKHGRRFPRGCSAGDYQWFLVKGKETSSTVVVKCQGLHGFFARYRHAIVYPAFDVVELQ